MVITYIKRLIKRKITKIKIKIACYKKNNDKNILPVDHNNNKNYHVSYILNY